MMSSFPHRTCGRALLLVVLSAAGLPGCRVIAGIDDRAPPDDSPPASLCGGVGATFFTELAARSALCPACLQGACCAPSTACAQAPECLALSSCREACKPYDVACEQRCDRDHPDGLAALEGLKQCTQDGCADACKIGTLWDCVGNAPPLRAASSGPVSVRVSLNDASGAVGQLAGAVVRACPRSDPSCQLPASEVVADANGIATLSVQIPVDTSFDGYIQVTHPKFLTLLVLMNPPVVADITLPPLIVVSPLTLGGFALSAGTTRKAGAGHILATAIDCGGAFAPDVSFSVSPSDGVTAVYTGAKGFDPEKGLNETRALYGLGVLLNVAPGDHQFSYRVNELNLFVNSLTVPVFADTITQIPAIAYP